MIENHGNFMDHGPPPVPVTKCLSERDFSAPYEVDEAAIFKTENGFIGVVISGCS